MKFSTILEGFFLFSLFINQNEAVHQRESCPQGFYLSSNGKTCLEGVWCPEGTVLNV